MNDCATWPSGGWALPTTGILRPVRPDTLAREALALGRDGRSPAAADELAAARYPRQPAVVDGPGTLSFDEVTRQITTLTSRLEAAGIGRGDRVGRRHLHLEQHHVSRDAAAGARTTGGLNSSSFIPPGVAAEDGARPAPRLGRAHRAASGPPPRGPLLAGEGRRGRGPGGGLRAPVRYRATP